VWTSAVTPYEAWTGKVPNLKHLRIFGSYVLDAYVHIPKQFTQKFNARASKKIFVGYTEESTNYRVYDPESKKVSIARNVVFNETVGTSPMKEEKEKKENEITLPLPEVKDTNEYENRNVINAEEDDGINEEQEEEDNDETKEQGNKPAPRTSKELQDRSRIQTLSRYRHNADVAEYTVPMTYKEATNSPEAAQWTGVILNELKTHKENNTWKLVKKTPEMRLIDSK